LPLALFNVPARCNFIQLHKVCTTTPRLRAAAAIGWPDSTSAVTAYKGNQYRYLSKSISGCIAEV
jgi:hypothetical protein